MKYIYKNTLAGVDMDMVLTNWDDPKGSFINHWKTHFGDLKYLGVKKSAVWDIAQLFPGHEKRLDDFFMNPPRGFYLNLRPMPGAIAAVKKMMETMEVVAVTTPVYEADDHTLSLNELESRDRLWCQVVEEKKEWLRKYFGKDAPVLNPLSDKTLAHVDFLIDDKPSAGQIKRNHPSWIHVLYDDDFLFNKNAKNRFRLNWRTWEDVMPGILKEVERRKKLRAFFDPLGHA